ncbi:hypothetical protein HR060_04645 [Catenovulum sp. SM1970]|uniref:hypothetical protein n=1 Tax=Marinifaba aquimaris TaxID=2741323 RepID=UPI0015743FA6|nr:hypothetical protein [Marinifaba aquimaris]NTS76150.1 hypothetical protein [Marinifaba aquimaris]
MKKLIPLSLFAVLVSACSTTPQAPIEIDRSDELYLRGSFTWWDAEKDYLVKKVQDQVYRTTVDLVADGQPYEFRFADEAWSTGNNCGYLDKASDETIALDTPVTGNCLANYESFLFTPDESGKYDFYIDFTLDEVKPKIWIKPHQPGLLEQVVEPINKALPDL